MKKLLLACIALLCLQLLHASPTKTSKNNDDDGDCGHDDNDSGKASGGRVTYSESSRDGGKTTVKDGHTEVTRSSSSSSNNRGENDGWSNEHDESVTKTSKSSSKKDGDCSDEDSNESGIKKSSSSSEGGSTSKKTVVKDGKTVVVTQTTSTSSSSNSDKDGHGGKTSSSSKNGGTSKSRSNSDEDDDCSGEDSNESGSKKSSSSSEGGSTSKKTVEKDGNKVVVTKTTSSSSSSSGDKDGNGHVVSKTSSSSSDNGGTTSKQTVSNNGNTMVVTQTTSSSSSSSNDKDGHGHGYAYGHGHGSDTATKVSSNSSHNRGDDDDNDCSCGHGESSSSNNGGTTSKQTVVKDGKTVVVSKTTTSSSSSSNSDTDEHGHGHTTTKTSSSSVEIEINRLNAQIIELTKQIQQKEINYNLLNVDFKAVKSENTVLQSKLNTANAETQSWKSQFEALTINFKQISADKVKCDGSLKESQSLIVTIQQTIVDIQITNKKLVSESTQCKADLKTAQKDVSVYSTTNIELNIKIKDANDKFTRCQSDSSDLTKQNSALKTSADDLKKTLATCQTDKTKLSEQLKVKMSDYNSDERKIQENMALLKSTQVLLEQCKVRNNELEMSSKTQKVSIDDLTKKISVIKAECDDQLKCAHDNLNQCKISLTTQTEQRTSIEASWKSLKVQITEIQIKLDISIKAEYEANTKAKQYQADSNGYKGIIDQLKSTIKDTNTELSKCTTDRTKCENNSQTTIAKLQQTIVDIQSANAILNSDSTKCKLDLDISRKETTASKSTIIDLNNRIKDATDKLTSCLNDGHTTALTIISIRQESDEMKKNLLACQGERNNLSELLKAKISDYNKDEIKMQQDMVLLKTTQSLLEQCQTSKKDVVTSYETEKTTVLELTKKISVYRAEYDETIRKYEDQNRRTVDDYNQCKISLKIEIDYRLTIDIEVRTLRTQVIEIQNRLDITIKTVEKANSKANKCEEDSNGLKVTIDQLKGTITDTNTELTKCAAEKTNCNVSLKESKTTIFNLQQTVVEIQNININLNGDSSKCKLELEDSQKDAKSCRASNDELNNKIKAAYEKLSGCERDSHEVAIRIINLKSSSDELKKNLSSCTDENINLSESLKATLARFEDDERLDDLGMTQVVGELKATRSLLDKCNLRYTEVEESYESEKDNVFTLTKKVAEYRAEYDEKYRKYTEDIERSLDNLNKCKASLQIEIDIKSSIEINFRKLEIHITEITNQLNISIKSIEEANSKTKRCEIDFNDLTAVNVELKSTLESTTGALTKCAQHSTSLQSDLTNIESRLTQITINFENSQSTIYTLQQTIVDIKNINNKLETDKTQCEIDFVASVNGADECSATNVELTRAVKDLTDKLTSCQSDDNEAALEIRTLKSHVDKLNQNVRTCEDEKIDLSELLEAKIADYNNDEIRLQEQIARLTSTQTHLDQCTARNIEIETSYEKEKASVTELTKTIGVIRTEHSESRRTYEERIEILLGNWNECKGSLKSGTDSVRNLEIQITEITNQLNISIKNVYEANSNTKRCETESKDLRVIIDQLTSTNTDTSSDLSRCGAEKTKCEINLKDSQSTTVTLQKTIESIENTNKKLNADTEQCKLDLEVSVQKSTTYSSTIDDLNKTIQIATEKFTSCQNDSHEDALRIITLRTSEDELKHSLTVCKGENTNLSELFQAKIADYTNDQMKLQEEIARLKSTQTLLDLCTARSTDLEASYELTKVNILNLTNKMAENRAECEESTRKFTEEIRNSVDTINKCRASLQSETDEKESIKIIVRTLNIQITEIQNNIVIYQKAVDEANSKTKKCVDNSKDLNTVIEQLRCSLTDTSAELNKCRTHSTSLQNEVKDKGSKLDKCNSSLESSKTTITTLQKTIEEIQKINRKLTEDTAQYKRDLNASQKDVSSCRATNDDLNNRIRDANEKLKGCENSGHADALKIIQLKSDADDLRKIISVCQTENINISESLKIAIAKFEDDERFDELTLNQEIAEQRATKALLDRCEADKTEMSVSYESVKLNIRELTSKIESISAEYHESSKNRDEKITLLTGNLDQCETSLKSETDAVHRLDVEINDLERRLDISTKAVDEANSNTKRCESDSDNLKDVIDELRSTVTEKSTKLKNCEDLSTSLQDNLTDSSSKLDQCTVSLANSQSTVTSLEDTIKEIENINKKLNGDITECEFDLVASESGAEECSAANVELNRVVKDLTDKLTSCESDDYEAAVQILTLKTTVDELNQNVRTCQDEKVDLSELLEAKIADYNNDEIRLQAEIARLTSTQKHLDQCTDRVSEIETSYEQEKVRVAELTNTIGVIRSENSESKKTYEERIEILLGNWNECKGSLKSGTDAVRNLEIQITEITNQLNISIKTINEVNSKTIRCEDESKGYLKTIDQLQNEITDKSTELLKCGAEKSKCEINLKDSYSTTITLERTIESIQNTNTKLNDETKQCKQDLEGLEKKSAACTSANSELNSKIKTYIEKLEHCENESHEDAIQIINLKSTSDDLRKNLSSCQSDNISLTESLIIAKAKFEDDERFDELTLNQEIAEQRATKALLDQCVADKEDLEESYEIEKKNVFNLTNKNKENRAEYDDAIKKCTVQIEILVNNVNQCKDSLKSESDDKVSIQIRVNTLEVKITEIQNSLDISQKAVYDANSQTRQCLEDSDSLKIVIEDLNRTVKEKSSEISRFEQQTISQQNELTTCGEKLDHCSTNYILSQSTIDSLRETLTDIEKINTRLNTDTTQCKHDLESSLKEAHTCSETNANLNIKITEVSDKLIYCETDGHKNSLQIISLKSSSDELRNNLSTCQSEKSTLSELLNAKIADYNQEELERQEEMALLKTTQALLKQCTSSKDEIDEHYQIEKDNVIELTNTLARVRTECTDSFNNCNQQIQQLLDNLNQCRTTLQSESNVKASIEMQLKNLEIEYTDIQHVLDITKKAVDEANKNVKTCEEEKSELDTELSGLSCTVDTYLKFVKDREAVAYQSFNDGIDQFIGSNNIQCTIRP